MERTLTNFIHALRNSDVRISTAETLDAFNAVELVGYEDRDFLRRTLSLVLPKTADEKETFENCFDQFFSFEDVRGERHEGGGGAEAGDAEGEESGGDGEGGGAGGEPQPGQKASGGKGKAKKKKGQKWRYSLSLGQKVITCVEMSWGIGVGFKRLMCMLPTGSRHGSTQTQLTPPENMRLFS